MHIFIDGRSISHPRRGGFKTYAEGLVAGLASCPGDHQFTIVYDRAYHFPPLAGHARFHEVVSPAWSKMAGQLYREHVALPAITRGNPDAVWHWPYNYAPLIGGEDYLLTLHDLTAYTHRVRLDWSRPGLAVREILLYYYPRLLIRRSARRAAMIVTVSGYARGRIAEVLGMPASKIACVPLAASPLYYPLGSSEKRGALQKIRTLYGLEKPFVLTVASSLLKNPQGVVQAYAALPGTYRDKYDLVIVMAHERVRVHLETLARNLQVFQQVHFLVGVEPENLNLLYNVAQTLVYPSLTESFPLPTAEAMACGTPIICSNTTGFPEQVGDAALLCEPTDMDAIVTGMTALLASDDARRNLGQAGLKRSQQFSWANTAAATLAIYQTCADVRARHLARLANK